MYFFGDVSPDKQSDLYKVSQGVCLHLAATWLCGWPLACFDPVGPWGAASTGPQQSKARAFHACAMMCGKALACQHAWPRLTCAAAASALLLGYGMVCLQHLVGCLAKVLDSRDSTSPEVAAAGMVINTMGYIDGLGYELLAAAVTTFRVRSWGARGAAA